MSRWTTPALTGRPMWPLVAATILALGLVLASPGSQLVLAQDTAAAPPVTISVAGLGQSEIEPDEAVVQLGVTARGETAQRATQKAANAMQSVIASLRDSGVEEADIKTTRLELGQTRRRDKETNEVQVRWELRNRVKATIRDIDATSDTIDAAIAARATTLDRLHVQASDPSAALAAAREDAVAQASLAALQLAGAADVELVRVLSIVEDGFRSGLNEASSGRFYAEHGPRLASTPIQPGRLDIASPSTSSTPSPSCGQSSLADGDSGLGLTWTC